LPEGTVHGWCRRGARGGHVHEVPAALLVAESARAGRPDGRSRSRVITVP
jgi:hypothetical protein